MKHQHFRLAVSLLLLVSSLCLALLGCNYAPALAWSLIGSPEASYTAQSARWRQLPTPPVEIEKMLAVDYFTVYARSRDGGIWGCYRESRFDERCWFELDAVPAVTTECRLNGLFPEIPAAIQVAQEIRAEYCELRDKRSAFSYVLDNGGNIWQWGFMTYWILGGGPTGVERINILTSFIGIVTGSFLPVLLAVLLWSGDLARLLKQYSSAEK